MLRIRQPQLGGVGGTSYTLTAAQGSFTLTGQDANLVVGRLPLTADQGAYTLTGQDATLTYDQNFYTVTADAGSFTLTGQSAGLTYTPFRQQQGGGFGWYPPKLVRAAKRKKSLRDLHADDVRQLFEVVTEAKGQAPVAAQKAVERARAPVVRVVPRPDPNAPTGPPVNWDSVAADVVATHALLQAYRQMLDEQDALAALLLA